MDGWPASDQLAVYDPKPRGRRSQVTGDPRSRIARARVDMGLAVSPEIISAVLAENARSGHDGSLTEGEQDDVDEDGARVTRAQAVLAGGDHVFSALAVDWLDGLRIVRVWLTGEHQRYRRLLTDALGPDRVLVEPASHTAEELGRYALRVRSDADGLAAQGIYLSLSGAATDGVDIEYYAVDFDSAHALLHDRYGAFARIRYAGASQHAIAEHPFGSWHTTGKDLHLFYALPHNGEHPGSAAVIERDDSVIVSLSIADWRGAKTLIGGFTPTHATVTLREPLGTRAVIDNSENRARPHWSKVAESS